MRGLFWLPILGLKEGLFTTIDTWGQRRYQDWRSKRVEKVTTRDSEVFSRNDLKGSNAGDPLRARTHIHTCCLERKECRTEIFVRF